MGRVQKGDRAVVINGKSVLAVIPARGGSKRLPGKNILPLAGKPLITWTIEAGLKSMYIDKIIVSSEDKYILEISSNLGVKTVQRPLELAKDNTSTFSAVEHVLNAIDDEFEYIILLQPTSPLRKKTHIDEAFELLIKKNADAVVSVCRTDHSPLWSNTLPEDGCMKNFLKDEIRDVRSQDLPKYYMINGAIYIYRIDKLLKEKTFFINDKIFAYRMVREHSVDIDETFDLKLAELIINSNLC